MVVDSGPAGVECFGYELGRSGGEERDARA